MSAQDVAFECTRKRFLKAPPPQFWTQGFSVILGNRVRRTLFSWVEWKCTPAHYSEAKVAESIISHFSFFSCLLVKSSSMSSCLLLSLVGIGYVTHGSVVFCVHPRRYWCPPVIFACGSPRCSPAFWLKKKRNETWRRNLWIQLISGLFGFRWVIHGRVACWLDVLFHCRCHAGLLRADTPHQSHRFTSKSGN